MAQPPKDNQTKLRQLQEEFAVRAKLKKQYDAEMAGRYTRDMPSFSEWLAQRNQVPGMAGGGSLDYTKRENQNMGDPGYRAYLEKAQALEPDYTDLMLAGPMVKGFGMLANAARAATTPAATGPVITAPIGWKIRVPSKETLGEYTMPPPAVFNPRTAEEIASAATKKIPEKLKNIFVEDIPRNVASAIGTLDTIVNRYQDSQKKASGGIARMADGGKPPSLDTMRLSLTKNKLGMHSPMEKAAMSVPRTKGTAQEFMTEMQKQPGFRAEELQDRPIPPREGKMTKEEFLSHLRSQAEPQIQTKVLQDEGPHWEAALDRAMSYEEPADEDDDGTHWMNLKEIAREDVPKTKYGDYTLPGGENYREVLLTLPAKQGPRPDDVAKQMFGRRYNDLSAYQQDQVRRMAKANDEDNYRSSHWDEPNVLAHLRLSDRKGPNGEKVLHIEEIQSDWHQEGRKKGYINPEYISANEKASKYAEAIRSKYGDAHSAGLNATPEERSAYQELVNQAEALRPKNEGGVPDAPHKKSWHELALKHALTEAVKGKYHGIAITPGEQQAERYDLSKHVDQLVVYPDNTLVARKNGRNVVEKSFSDENELASLVGKDVAAKLISEKPDMNNQKVLSGQDLKVGGEGMKGFYDKIVPTYLNKLGKPHGAQVGRVPIVTKTMQMRDGRTMRPYEEPIEQKNLHYFPITESLRKQIKEEGLPQYTDGGNVQEE